MLFCGKGDQFLAILQWWRSLCHSGLWVVGSRGNSTNDLHRERERERDWKPICCKKVKKIGDIDGVGGEINCNATFCFAN